MLSSYKCTPCFLKNALFLVKRRNLRDVLLDRKTKRELNCKQINVNAKFVTLLKSSPKLKW